jgi:multidrug efflux pump subunit AcrA (membrane-fusion protein)
MRKKTTWGLGLVGIPLLIGGVYWAVPDLSLGTPTPEQSSAALPVSSFTAEPVDGYHRPRPYTGVIREFRRSSLGFRRGGEIVELYVQEGDAVSTGQALARLDNRHLLARRENVEAQVSEAAAVLEELEAGPRAETIAAKRAELAAQTARRDLLALQVARREKLLGTNTVPVEEYEATLYDYRAAIAVCEQIERQLDEYLAGTRSEQISAQHARHAQLEAQLAEVVHDLEDTQLKAPFAGRVSRRLVDEGTIASPGSAVLEILDDTQLEAWIGLPPSATENMRPGERHTIEVAGKPIPTTLRALGPDVDRATRTRKVILYIAPDDSVHLLPGQTVRMTVFERVVERGFWVPTSALARGRRGLWSVYVVEEQEREAVVGQREVELLDTVGEQSFVRGTLRPGDHIVAAGTHRVVVGQQVLAQPIAVDQSGH